MKKITKLLKKCSTIVCAACIISALCFSNIAVASNQDLDADSIYKQRKTETIIEIINKETGETIEYTLNLEDSIVTTSMADGKTLITQTVEIPAPNEEIMPFIDTSLTSDIKYGHKGTVELTYSDDGTFACLERVVARWDKVSGSYTVKFPSVNYGQILGTNSENRRADIVGSNQIIIGTGFKPGKYGGNQNHVLGANLNGEFGSNWVSVTHNIHF